MTNPESDVVAAIDELIDAQLAAGPHDDYNADYYPKCDRCGCDWHGEECQRCGCEASTGEVLSSCSDMTFERRELNHRVAIDDVGGLQEDWARSEALLGAPWVTYHEQDDSGVQQRGYTLADIEAMRNYPQRYVLGAWRRRRRLVVRFWGHSPQTRQLHLVEGTVEVTRVDWNRDGVSIRLRLDPYRQLARSDDEEVGPLDPVPASDMVPDMIAMEGNEGGGFEPIGYLSVDDFQENYEIVIRVNAISEPILERLLDPS